MIAYEDIANALDRARPNRTDVVRNAQFRPYASTNATPVVPFTPRTIAV
jgi:hypothetical protein